MKERVFRGVLFSGGVISLLLAAIGALLPLVPSTPFILLAAFCFARSSERIHQWLCRQPGMGPVIRDWELHGVIRRPAKVFASLIMIALSVYPLGFMSFPIWLKGIMGTTIFAVLVFLWSRPSQAPELQFPASHRLR